MVILKQSGGPGCVQTLAPRAATEIVGFLPGAGAVMLRMTGRRLRK